MPHSTAHMPAWTAAACASTKMILATRNAGKVREFNSLLHEVLGDIPLVSLAECGLAVPEVEEDGDTFEANALKKALEVSLFTGMSVLADDSGLEVDALGGRPGVYSARYAGEQGDDHANNLKLVQKISGVPADQRQARYVAVLALCLAPDAEGQALARRFGIEDAQPFEGTPALGVAVRQHDRIVLLFRGTCEGVIITQPRGEGGFGYDPYFLIPQWDLTMAEVPLDQKNTISHRAQVVKKLLSFAPN